MRKRLKQGREVSQDEQAYSYRFRAWFFGRVARGRRCQLEVVAVCLGPIEREGGTSLRLFAAIAAALSGVLLGGRAQWRA